MITVSLSIIRMGFFVYSFEEKNKKGLNGNETKYILMLYVLNNICTYSM